MRYYEVRTANTTYHARVIPGRYAHDWMLAAAHGDGPTVLVYGGRFGVIEPSEFPKKGCPILGKSSGRRVATSPVQSIRRIGRRAFLDATDA
jgi:hypothetical protein